MIVKKTNDISLGSLKSLEKAYDVIDNNLKRDIKGFNFIGNASSFTFITVLSIMAAIISSIMFLGLFAYISH
ncbi:hypothetical protein [Campylobacter coli]|uniref:hypothetical protein n=1 Tax=Campylobacter coli TaxID=195 RepID=UPI0011AAF5ED|nr:hypothetical protein [Campylobacter coli]